MNKDDGVIITPETALKLAAHCRETRARLAEEAGPEHACPAKMPARQRLKAGMSHKKSAVK